MYQSIGFDNNVSITETDLDHFDDALVHLDYHIGESSLHSVCLTANRTVHQRIWSNGKERNGEPNCQNGVYQDSPYYQALLQNETDSLGLWCSVIKDISCKASAFASAGSEMATAMCNLAKACKLRSHGADDAERKEMAVGSETAIILERLGQVLEEIATAQKCMCDTVAFALDSHLEEIAKSRLTTAKTLKDDADNQTKRSDDIYLKYLNGQQRKETCWAAYINLEHSDSSESFSPQYLKQSLSSLPNITNKSTSTNAMFGLSSYSESKQIDQDQLERTVCMEKVAAELKRFYLYKYILHAKRRRSLEIGCSLQEAFSGISTYFSFGNHMLQELVPCFKTNQQQCKKLQIDNENDKLIWQNTEKELVDILNMIEIQPSETDFESPLLDADGAGTCSLWDLPETLADCSHSLDGTSKDVILEGWLYQKRSSDRPFFSSWTKRWFALTEDELNCVEVRKVDNESTVAKDSSDSTAASRVSRACIIRTKICNTSSCSVSILASGSKRVKSGSNYCFELRIPHKKPVILRAGGAKALDLWVGAISEVKLGSYVSIKL